MQSAGSQIKQRYMLIQGFTPAWRPQEASRPSHAQECWCLWTQAPSSHHVALQPPWLPSPAIPHAVRSLQQHSAVCCCSSGCSLPYPGSKPNLLVQASREIQICILRCLQKQHLLMSPMGMSRGLRIQCQNGLLDMSSWCPHFANTHWLMCNIGQRSDTTMLASSERRTIDEQGIRLPLTFRPEAAEARLQLLTWRFVKVEPSFSSRNANAPAPCSLPVFTQPPNVMSFPTCTDTDHSGIRFATSRVQCYLMYRYRVSLM